MITTSLNPSTVGALATRALLVDVDRSLWNAHVKDREGQGIIARARGSKASTSKVTKYLLPDRYMDPIFRAAQDLGDFHRAMTLPWIDRGPRICKAEKFLDWERGIDQRAQVLMDAVEYLYEHYDEAKAEARADLNGGYREEEYPPRYRLKSLYSVRKTVLPLPKVPDPDDFRQVLGDVATAQVIAQAEESIQAMLDKALTDILARANKVIGKMVKDLRDFNPDAKGAARGTFRDTLVSNVAEFADLLPSLNIMDSPEIDAFIKQIKANLTSVEAEDLRTDPKLRAETAKQAEEILASINDFFA